MLGGSCAGLAGTIGVMRATTAAVEGALEHQRKSAVPGASDAWDGSGNRTMPKSVVIDGTRYIAERPQHKERRPLAELVAEARDANGQTLEQAASAIGSTKSHMLAIERGTEPRLPMLQKLLRHYGITFDEIADA